MEAYILKVDEKSAFARHLIEMILIYTKSNKDIVLKKEHSESTKKAIIESKTHQGETFQKANRMINDLLEFE